MREIIFRGKRVDNGEWVEGYYFKAKRHWNDIGVHEDWIADGAIQNGGWCNVVSKHAVIPTSISEFTGLTDKNGKRIFEGDIIHGVAHWLERYVPAVVTFRNGSFGLLWYRGEVEEFNPFTSMCNVEYTVVGNIYDNPELMKGGE